jgi:hypothetical protein
MVLSFDSENAQKVKNNNLKEDGPFKPDNLWI